jgi:acetyl esterase/lipase
MSYHHLFKAGFPVAVAIFLIGCLNPFPKGTDAFYNRSYGPHQRNKLDIYLPEERDSSTETVLLIHGGAWIAGDKGGAELRDIRNRLLNEGYAVASMNYRYACGDHHKQMEDVANALNHIVAHSSDWKINNHRFALIGFSAGGHLALLYGHAFDENHLVKTVISIFVPTVLTDSLFRQYISNYNITWTVEQLLGATFEADSALYAEASPLFNWSNVPTLFLYGGMDDLVPMEQGIVMFDTLIANGIVADTTIPAQGDHNVNGPNNIYKDEIEAEVLDWLQLHLKH